MSIIEFHISIFLNKKLVTYISNNRQLGNGIKNAIPYAYISYALSDRSPVHD